MRTMVIAVSAAALMLAVAGCGGDSENSADDATTTENADTTASTDTGGGTDTGSDTTDSDGDVSLANCTKLTDLSAKFSQALGAATSASGADDLDATAEAYEEFADEAPEEIRDAFKTVGAAFAAYAEAFEDIDLSSGATPDPDTIAKITAAVSELDNAELTAASAEIAAWATENCTTG